MAKKFTTIDCCPVDTRLYPILLVVKQRTGCVFQSIYRGSHPAAKQYLTGGPPCYKHDQTWIYRHYPPGVANPPGISTHEERNDGVAYRGWRGQILAYWQCGLDIDDPHVQAVIRELARLGFTATITYPGSRVEYHHINLRKAPSSRAMKRIHSLLFPVLRVGKTGVRVKSLTGKLAYVHSPHTHKPYLTHKYWTYTTKVRDAVKQFQRDHHQKADGLYGVQTARQLSASYRWWKRNKQHKK